MQTVLITGFSGMLGRELTAYFQTKGLNVLGISQQHSKLLPKEKQLNIDLSSEGFQDHISEHFNPDIVIHAAAFTNLKYCEEHPEKTVRFHSDCTGILAQRFQNSKFIYISTDSVFDGQRGNYSELDKVNPLNLYASSKQRGEEQALNSGADAYVIRTNIIGYHEPLKTSLFEWVYKSLKEEGQINGFSNVLFNPLFCGFYGELIENFILSKPQIGIYNFAASDEISKYEFLTRVAQEMKLNSSLISPLELINEQGGVIRPLNTTLNTQKAQMLGLKFPSMDENIKQLCWNFKSFIQKHGI